MKPSKSPIAQSVFDRLKTLALQCKEDFNALLARYGNERFLYRLSKTDHASKFVLKGAMMFVVWLNRQHRPTRDMDLLGMGEVSEQSMRNVFMDVCNVPVEADGLAFDPSSIQIEEIRENQVYHGLRVKIRGTLGTARMAIQVDVGIGDAITPEPVQADYPVLLDQPRPRLKVYPAETVVAEKLDAMLQLGLRNSRMKDFYDLWLISRSFKFEGTVLSEAIRRTVERRKSELQESPACFTEEFARDTAKNLQWKAFLRQNHLSDAPVDFSTLMAVLRPFLAPVVQTVRSKTNLSLEWAPGGSWRPTTEL